MSQNWIGNFRFVTLSRPPELLQQQVLVRSRPGVDGVMIQRTGSRARPFQVASMVDAGTIEQAFTLYHGYTQLVGGNAVSVVWADQALVNISIGCVVLGVEPVDIRRIVRGHGGLNGWSYARCECLWTLQPAAITS